MAVAENVSITRIAPGAARTRMTVRSAWYGLFLLAFCNVFASMDRGIITILIDQIKADLGLSDTALGLLTGLAFQAVYVIAGFPLARIADRVSAKLVIWISLMTWSTMTCVCGFAGNGFQLLLARIGVGLGEAGGNAPSQGLISNMFDKADRSRALGIFNMGVTLGAPSGWLVGALVSEAYGWRMAFVAAGLPGIVLALVIALTLREPDRKTIERAEPLPFRQSIAFLLSQRSFVLTLAGALFFNFSYAANAWLPSFLSRVHGLSLREVGFSMAATHGVFGTIGVVCGGMLASRLGRTDERVRLWLAAIACLLGCGPYLFFLLADGEIGASGFPIALVGLCGVYLVLASVFGPMMAAYQAGARADMRSLAAAVYWVVGGLGLSLGPFLIGLFNDLLKPDLGQEAVRYSLLLAVGSLPFAAIFFYLASRYITADAARAEAALNNGVK